MNPKTVVIAVATVLALTASVGGVVATEYVHSFADDDTSEETPAEPTITVIDPDDLLTDELIETAIDLAWEEEDVQAAFEESEALAVTVDSTGGLDDVNVGIVGAPDEASAADVDLEMETVTNIVTGDRVSVPDRNDSTSAQERDQGLNQSDINVSVSTEGELVVALSELELTATGIHAYPVDEFESGTEDEMDVIFTTHLAAVDIEVVDRNELLDDAETTLLEELVVTDNTVDSHLEELPDEDTAVDGWTLTVSEPDDSEHMPDDEGDVAVEVTHQTADGVVSVLADLDDPKIIEVETVE